MARSRLELQAILEQVLGSGFVYFQPPENVVMTYPCIVYEHDDVSEDYADNLPYRQNKAYQVTLIDPNPDSPTFDAIKALPLCRFNRHFATSGLNHDVFVIHH